MRRFAFALVALALLSPAVGFGQAPDLSGDPSVPTGEPALPPLVGRVDGTTYYSPTGTFRITIPVLAELNGTITDTMNVVTFQDPFSTHISIATFPQDTTQKWRLETQGVRDYLQEFFYNYVWRDFAAYPGAKYEANATFRGKLFGGALFTYVTLPGGSMFNHPELRLEFSPTPPVAKRGNLMFVHDGYVYVVSTELAERITEGSLFKKTSDEEDAILRDRLTDIANRIHFLKPGQP